VLEPTTVRCDLDLTMASFGSPQETPALGEPSSPYDDIRIADLARLAHDAPGDFDAVVDGYAEHTPLSDAESRALPLVMVALELDLLAEILVTWVPTAPAPGPDDEVDEVVASVRARLDALGVPEESGPPPRGRSRR
jgi:hypothetical protein